MKKSNQKTKELIRKWNIYGLQNISTEDKNRVANMLKGDMGATLISIGSSAEDSAKIGLLQTIMDQNFMIIKLLNDIKNK